MIETSKNAPSVSVVMAVYGNWDDLPATMDSILRQTVTDLEVILIDDGNPAEGREAIGSVARKDFRIRLIVNEENIGLTRSLIRGCEAARAEYIARIDCGDLMVPRHRLSRQLECFHKDESLGLVSGGIEMWDLINRKRWRTRLRTRDHEETIALPRYSSWADHPTVMFRKSTYQAAGGYNPDLRVGQDTELWPRMSEHGRLLRLDEVFAVRTLKAESISVLRNSQQVRGKIARIKAQMSISRSRQLSLLLKEYLKLLVPMKLRLNIRHAAAMEFIAPIPESHCRSLEKIAELHWSQNRP